MGVNHRGRHIRMTKQFLNRANVGTRLQQVGGERVTQGVNRYELMNLRRRTSQLDGTLKMLLVQMVSALNA